MAARSWKRQRAAAPADEQVVCKQQQQWLPPALSLSRDFRRSLYYPFSAMIEPTHVSSSLVAVELL